MSKRAFTFCYGTRILIAHDKVIIFPWIDKHLEDVFIKNIVNDAFFRRVRKLEIRLMPRDIERKIIEIGYAALEVAALRSGTHQTLSASRSARSSSSASR